jgi:carbon-monoxide dehydrogenase medium subunit
MRDFRVHRPRELGECLETLAEHGEHAALLAGGTDLNVLMQTGIKAPAHVIDIGLIGELDFIRDQDGTYFIGATATHAGVASHFRDLNCLALAAGSVGSPQIRNMGTVGGNIANASPSGDSYPPLLALDAVVTLASSRGTREVALVDIPAGPGETSIQPDELITQVAFPDPGGDVYTDFIKVGLRKAMAISVASAAIVARGDGHSITDLRIACGAVAPTALRMTQVEELVRLKPPSQALIREAAEAAGAFCCPITDVRATADYRRHVTSVIVYRLVDAALRRLTGYSGE